MRYCYVQNANQYRLLMGSKFATEHDESIKEDDSWGSEYVSNVSSDHADDECVTSM